jgi:hypothetical protein
MLIAVLIVSLATALALGSLTLVRPRASAEPRLPKSLATVLAAAPFTGARVWHLRGGAGEHQRADGELEPSDGDVELAVRERLYGQRPSRR